MKAMEVSHISGGDDSAEGLLLLLTVMFPSSAF
jgi:hypothetical protein